VQTGVIEKSSIEEPWTVGDLSRLAKCTLRAVRFYEQQGLLQAPDRTEGRHRRYTGRDLERLRAIVALRRAGMPIQAIRRAMTIRQASTSGAAAAHQLCELLERQILELAEQLDQLQQLKSEFERLNLAVRTCRTCQEATYPSSCTKCSDAPNLKHDSALRVLWNHE
jgi:DNA-binding transcriptional MerR regulator